jgi:hypothetical protein
VEVLVIQGIHLVVVVVVEDKQEPIFLEVRGDLVGLKYTFHKQSLQ